MSRSSDIHDFRTENFLKALSSELQLKWGNCAIVGSKISCITALSAALIRTFKKTGTGRIKKKKQEQRTIQKLSTTTAAAISFFHCWVRWV